MADTTTSDVQVYFIRHADEGIETLQGLCNNISLSRIVDAMLRSPLSRAFTCVTVQPALTSLLRLRRNESRLASKTPLPQQQPRAIPPS